MTDDPTANDAAAFSDLIGLEFTDIEEGYSRGELDVTDRLRNPHGVLHGAVAYAMADTGMGAALYPGLGADELCATIEVKISYLEPVSEGTLVCETTVTKRGRTVAYLESDVTVDGESIARATGSYSIFES
ncbi:PaaI family thioesterase [Haloglomus salinum]|jgi:acyl-CoA thioesterase|uniref:PaaI family thioesterase n=1 Tax=Haloglomus salinum TaxID=2962673 RepID=UPI0020C967B7|nr:PaaI family thioesterase [Haloglomus salinum]